MKRGLLWLTNFAAAQRARSVRRRPGASVAETEKVKKGRPDRVLQSKKKKKTKKIKKKKKEKKRKNEGFL